MARRVVVALLAPIAWAPPGVDPVRWRSALAEDVVDLLAMLNEVDTAVAVTSADRWLADEVIWPGTRVYEVPEPSPNAVFAALSAARTPFGTDRRRAPGRRANQPRRRTTATSRWRSSRGTHPTCPDSPSASCFDR